MNSLKLKINNLHAGYIKDSNIINGLDLDIFSNEIVALVGQNGSGKSTLAKAIINLVPYRNGEIFYKNKDLVKKNIPVYKMAELRIGAFMQEGLTFTNLTVEENLKFAGRNLDKKTLNEYFIKHKELFDLLQNNKNLEKNASLLSGGEKHQLALIMILLQEPKFLILDEPSAGLSPINRGNMFKLIETIQKELKLSILLIEQNVTEAHKIAHRMALLKLGKIDKIKETKKINDLEQFFLN
ncbi:ATP-binding cassette domain-containing protein [bacterium]|nr:ATP-binding cassette domain-containing protein [bacterium]